MIIITINPKWTGIWPLNPNSLLHYSICIQAFDVHDSEYAYVVDFYPYLIDTGIYWVTMLNMLVLLNMTMN